MDFPTPGKGVGECMHKENAVTPAGGGMGGEGRIPGSHKKASMVVNGIGDYQNREHCQNSDVANVSPATMPVKPLMGIRKHARSNV